jgi:hypothetical protein
MLPPVLRPAITSISVVKPALVGGKMLRAMKALPSLQPRATFF